MHRPRADAARGADGDERDVTRQVQAFYEQYHFPGVRPPEQDGLILMRRLLRTVARRREGRPLRVLDAGCGTGNTMLALARRLSDARFLGVDLSESSLAIARAAAADLGLTNVGFRQADLRDPLDDEQPFDVVLCMGVLHHTADMRAVLARLREALAEDSDLYLWVYGVHGRYRHRLNARLLKMLLEAGPEADDPIAFAREFLEHTSDGMALADLAPATERIAAGADVLRNPAWIADQFLHPRDEHVDLERLLAIVEDSGLGLAEWLGVDTRPERYLGSAGLRARFHLLAPRERLLALDLLLKPDRYFVRLRREAG
jgi:SAM-dependent methyltransferase